MSKILIEKKVLNSIFKSIEVHLNLIKESDISINDPIQRERIYNSIEHLMNLENMVNNIEKDLKIMKRNAYAKYLNAKKKVDEAYKGNDEKEINSALKEQKLMLDYYLALKEASNLEGNK